VAVFFVGDLALPENPLPGIYVARRRVLADAATQVADKEHGHISLLECLHTCDILLGFRSGLPVCGLVAKSTTPICVGIGGLAACLASGAGVTCAPAGGFCPLPSAAAC